MKRLILFFALLLSMSIGIFAQEVAKPLYDTEVLRRVSVVDIEGIEYEDVTVTMKSTSPNELSSSYKVKVTIKNAEGKKIWKRTLKNAYLYVFSSGQVQVGKNNFDQVVIYRVPSIDDFVGKIRVKEGVYFY